MPGPRRSRRARVVRNTCIALAVLALALVAGAWWLIAPRSIPPADDWAARWNAIANAGPSDATELYAQAGDIYDAAIIANPDDPSGNSLARSVEAIDALRFAQWDHPAHQEGIDLLRRLSEAIGLCAKASRVPPRARLIHHDTPTSIDHAQSLLDDLVLPTSTWHASLRRVLVAEMRVAVNTDRTYDSIAAFDALLALAGHQAADPGMIHKLVAISTRRAALAQAAAIATSGEGSPELLRGYLQILDTRPPLTVNIDQTLQAERIIGELTIWIDANEARLAPASDVARSFAQSIFDPEDADDPALHRRRRLNYVSTLRFLDAWHARARELWNLPADQLGAAPSEPVYAPYPELTESPFLPDIHLRFRENIIIHAIDERAYRNVIDIALFKAENSALPLSLAEAVSEEACVVPHTHDPFVYARTDAPPGFSLRLPTTPSIRAIDPQWRSTLNLPGYAETEFAETYKPINRDDFPELEWDDTSMVPES